MYFPLILINDLAILLIFVDFSPMPKQVVDPAHLPAIDISPVYGLTTAPAQRHVNLTSHLMLILCLASFACSRKKSEKKNEKGVIINALRTINLHRKLKNEKNKNIAG